MNGVMTEQIIRCSKPSFLVIAVVLTIGLLSQSMGAIFTRLSSDVPPVMIATYRMVFSSAILLVYWLARPKGKSFTLPSKKEQYLCMLSGLFLSGHFVTWIYSLQYTTVASSVVIVNMNAIFVGILAFLLFREKQSISLISGIAAAFTGCLILTVQDSNFKGFIIDKPGIFLGNCLALCGAFASSFYLLIGSRVRSSIDLLTYITIVYTTAAGILVFVSLVMEVHFTGYQPVSYLYLFLMAVFPQLIGHSSVNWALKVMKSSVVAVTKMGEPICSAILAYLIFSETVNLPQVGGIFLIFSAIVFVLKKGTN